MPFHLTRRQILAAPALLAQSSQTRPNILVVVLDDLGCRDLGFLGAKDLKTSNLDALASKSAVLSNWYSNAPVCAPARASILSGRYPVRAGVPANSSELTPGLPTLGSTFQAAGYRTAAIGKWHLGLQPGTHPNAHGFDSFYGFLNGCIDFYSHRFYWGDPVRPNFHDLWRNRTEIFEDGQYFTERMTDEAINFLSAKTDQPFCTYLAFNAPHYPMHAPDKYMRRFPNFPLERRTYAAMIAAVDDGIGRIRAALENRPVGQHPPLLYWRQRCHHREASWHRRPIRHRRRQRSLPWIQVLRLRWRHPHPWFRPLPLENPPPQSVSDRPGHGHPAHRPRSFWPPAPLRHGWTLHLEDPNQRCPVSTQGTLLDQPGSIGRSPRSLEARHQWQGFRSPPRRQ